MSLLRLQAAGDGPQPYSHVYSPLIVCDSEMYVRTPGFIEPEERHGAIKKLLLTSLSASVAICSPRKLQAHHEVSETLAEIKHQSKRIEGNNLALDQRETYEGSRASSSSYLQQAIYPFTYDF